MPSRLCCSTASQLQTCFRWSTPLTCNWAGGAPVSLCTLWRLGFSLQVWSRATENQRPALIRCYVAAGILSATLATLAYAGFLPWFEDILLMYRWRGRGFFKDPNVFGPYLVYVAILAISRWDTPGMAWRRKVLWTVVLLVVSAGVLLSFSRACLLNYGGFRGSQSIWSSSWSRADPLRVGPRPASGSK